MAAAGVVGEFELSPELEAHEPPEARGLRRDEVRLLVSTLDTDSIQHARFADVPLWLSPGDLLVVNTSATINAPIRPPPAEMPSTPNSQPPSRAPITPTIKSPTNP